MMMCTNETKAAATTTEEGEIAQHMAGRVCAGMASAMTMAMALTLAIVVMMTNGPKGTAGDGCERAGMITKCAALPCTHK